MNPDADHFAQIVYLPATPTEHLKSFSAPILNLHDTYVSAPFFGPNVWTAALQPVAGGGIPQTQSVIEMKMTFKDGGAYDFHTRFERVKEVLQQAIETAQASGAMRGDGSQSGTGRGAGALAGVDLAQVTLEQLPAYEAASPTSASRSGGVGPPQTGPSTDLGSRPPLSGERQPDAQPASAHVSSSAEVFQPPSDPPPGYEEVQQQSVASELDRRLQAGDQ